ncbi:MAG TPA: NEW3 domain-containing protein [Solirubrobacterales bacterium]|nr:NEW3 domain-containing protein [Solirubrobacterales bacterium]
MLAALAALLVFAAAASAETRTGESSTALILGSPTPEITLVNASASYETGTGSTVFKMTTAGAPDPAGEGMVLAALTTSQTCTASADPQALFTALLGGPPPLFLVVNEYSSPVALGIAGSLTAPQQLLVTKSVLGTTTTLSVTSAAVANAGFNCAIVAANIEEEVGEEEVGSGIGTFMAFPISAPPAVPPAAAVTPAPTAAPAPAPVPAPPVLSIGKLKPVTLKAGKSKSIKIKVTNTGVTGTGAGSLRVKPPKGVIVKPERQQLPVLAPGKSWTVTVRVQLTAKAKKQSKLSLTAAASGVTASGSLAVDLKE